MYSASILLLTFMVMIWSGEASLSIPPHRNLIFNEEFDILDPYVWNYDPNTVEHNMEFQLYTSSDINSYTEDGYLHIRPTIELDPEELNSGSSNFHPIRSARLSTKYSFAFTYGTVEIRARIPIGDWLFPALWLMPKENVYGTWPLSGEFDIMEARCNRNYTNSKGESMGADQVGATVHFGLNSSTDAWRHAHMVKNSDSYYSSDFHVYKMVWTPEKISFYVDDENMGQDIEPLNGGFFSLGNFSSDLTNPWSEGSIMSPFDQDFYLIINLAVGGIHFFSDSNINENGKPWSNGATNPGLDFWKGRRQWLPTWDMESDSTHFLIDYVRVYSL